MTIECYAAGTFAAVMGALSLRARMIRLAERNLRANEMVGNTVMKRAGDAVEYRYIGSASSASDVPVIFCENGLGAPLECWDWMATPLSAAGHVVCYNRPGYGATTCSDTRARILHYIYQEIVGDQAANPIVFIGHSIGTMVIRDSLARSSWLRNRVIATCLLDSTDPNLLAAISSEPQRWGKLTQALLLERLGAVLGTSLLCNQLSNEVDYRSSVQQRFMRFSVDPITVRSAVAELKIYAGHAKELSTVDLPSPLVISAELSHDGARSHATTQQAMAKHINARQVTIAGSAHRSILGFREHAESAAEHVVEWLDEINTRVVSTDQEVYA